MEITYRILTVADAEAVRQLLLDSFPLMSPDEQFSASDFRAIAKRFAEGTILAFADERLAGMGTGIFVDIDFDNLPPDEDTLIGDDECSAHTPDGDYYFGTDICVHPDFRGRGIARKLYEYRKNLAIKYNKKGFAGAAVLPGYIQHKDQLDAQTYCDKVVAGELFDATLSVQLRNGFEVRRVLADFIDYEATDNYCALIVWPNPDYTPPIVAS